MPGVLTKQSRERKYSKAFVGLRVLKRIALAAKIWFHQRDSRRVDGNRNQRLRTAAVYGAGTNGRPRSENQRTGSRDGTAAQAERRGCRKESAVALQDSSICGQ